MTLIILFLFIGTMAHIIYSFWRVNSSLNKKRERETIFIYGFDGHFLKKKRTDIILKYEKTMRYI